ncbi:MAG: ankyrin repeat domain-containing protein [Candidatus Zixiibacteriota bacterium]
MKKTALLTVFLFVLMGLAYAGEIHDAAEMGDLERVKSLLEGDAGLLSARAADGKTPLLSAAYMGNADIVAYLLDIGADINARTNSNSTALHGAGFHGRDEVVRLLIARKADLNAANNYGFTPLLSSCAGGRVANALMLIEAGADITARNQDGVDALLFSAYGRSIELVDKLLTSGASIDSKNNKGEGVLHYAAFGGNLELVKKLVDMAQDPLAKSTEGSTPLHSATGGGWPSVVEYLLAKGADVNAADAEGGTPVLNVVWELYRLETDSAVATLRLLVDKGADLNCKTVNQETPLVIAVYRSNPEVVSFLLDNNADPNIANPDGNTPLMLAVTRGDDDIARLLLNKGASVDIKDNHYGATALHMAACKGNLDVVKVMLELATDINVKDNDGHTPLYYAGRYGHKQIAQLLQSNGGTASNLNDRYDLSAALAAQVQPGGAMLWYLDHCGWAVKTANHFIIFDYWQRGLPTDPSLANGCIVPSEILDQNVEVFTSHTHRDHYDSAIFDWYGTLPKLTYYFGFQAELLPEDARMGYNGQPYEYIGPREHLSSDGMEIHTIRANDAGVGFLIETDGLKIYFAGDHAGWREAQRDGFISEIDYLSGLVENVDFAFVNVTGCHAGDTIALAEATFYTLDKLQPKVMVPTHGSGREWVYQNFADKVAAQGYQLEIICPREKGDRFCYRENQIM